jgi:hypothetical protein
MPRRRDPTSNPLSGFGEEDVQLMKVLGTETALNSPVRSCGKEDDPAVAGFNSLECVPVMVTADFDRRWCLGNLGRLSECLAF